MPPKRSSLSPPAAPMPVSAGPGPSGRASAPFLVWPVSQREFYRTICWALAPALAWGMVLFGSRALAMLLAALAATTFSYLLLKRWLKWPRGQKLMFVHCLLSVLVLVALAHPTWPVWIVAAVGLILPLALAAIGGAGSERIHVAVAGVLIVQYVILPHLAPGMYTGGPDAVLARDRLVMGDIRDQGPEPATLNGWPRSRDLGGDDAMPFVPPAVSAANTLDQVSDMLPSLDEPSVMPAARRPAGSAPARVPGTAGTAPASSLPRAAPVPSGADAESPRLSGTDKTRLSAVLDRAFVKRLPGIDTFLWGVAPNRIGAASLIGLTLAGLYLSYRYILRPRSVLFFLATFILATAFFLFTPATWMRVGPLTIWELLRQFPGQIVTLFNYLLFNSDAAFAGVVILALPGTEPLTDRGRRIFLALAACAAAALHRLEPATPAATLVLCILMPAAPLFDRVFTQRSWLNG